jgi:hypothetical protein
VVVSGERVRHHWQACVVETSWDVGKQELGRAMRALVL